jgi:hypothetical protein
VYSALEVDGLTQFELPSFEQQMALAQKHGLDTLLFCPNAWALRHRFVNQETGEVVRARCNRWECLYCGPRKVNLWRQLIREAQPTLHVVLTRVGWTVQEASRVYTTVLQYLRRGSKGIGRGHIGAREAYPVECFAVLEEHKDFERVGFHWHVLVKGVDYLPHEVVKEALRSATKGRSYVVRVRKIKDQRGIGYVTKYLTKGVTLPQRGTKQRRYEVVKPTFDAVEGVQDDRGDTYLYRTRLDEQGQAVVERVVQTEEAVSRARRIRYTRHFFPDSTAALRARLFADLDSEEAVLDGETPDLDSDAALAEGSRWTLYEQEPFSSDIQDYRDQRQSALEESLIDLREGKYLYSGRVVNVWAYQRGVLRSLERQMASHAQDKGE